VGSTSDSYGARRWAGSFEARVRDAAPVALVLPTAGVRATTAPRRAEPVGGLRPVPERPSPPPIGRARRIWSHVWLPLLLVALAVVLEPRINEFLLGLVLLSVALATTWLRDVARSRGAVGPEGTVGERGMPDGSRLPPSRRGPQEPPTE
jgi:hypothetical protein